MSRVRGHRMIVSAIHITAEARAYGSAPAIKVIGQLLAEGTKVRLYEPQSNVKNPGAFPHC